jgi:glycosyltransferase involved in cell wall biosynthesis
MNAFANTPPHEPVESGPREFLLVSGDFVPTGGMDVANYHLADFLARQGVPVHLVSHRVAPALLDHPNVTWHRAARPLGSNLIGERFLRRLGRRVAGRKELRGAGILVNGGNCPLPGVNWVHYVHAASQPHDGIRGLRKWKNALFHRLSLRDEAKALRRAQLVIANSERTKNDLVHRLGLPPDLIRVIYYGTDPALFHPVDDAARRSLRTALGLPADKFLVAFVGALGDRRKGFDTLFRAWQEAGAAFRAQAALVVVGRGAELPLWEQRAAALADGASIRFLGFRDDVPDILRACDAFVAPARYEAFGLAVQEALCCGLPAIVSRDAGVAERFSPGLDPLLLDDAENVSELAAKLSVLQAAGRAFRAEAVRLSVELRRHTWDDMARAIYMTYRPGEP